MDSTVSTNENQFWSNPDSEDKKPSLVRLTPETLCLAVIPKAELENARSNWERGHDLAAQTIPLSALTLVQGDKDNNDLTVTFHQGDSATDSVTISLPDPAQRDELLGALAQRLGPGWERDDRQRSRFANIWWPLGAVVFCSVLTWWTYGEAQEIAAGHQLKEPRRVKARIIMAILHWLEGQIGATGMLIAGGLLIAGCLLWLVAAVAVPPVRITIKPTSQP